MPKNHFNPWSCPLLRSSPSPDDFLPSSCALSCGISRYWSSLKIILSSKYHLGSTHTKQTKWFVPPPSSHTSEKTNLRSGLIVYFASESASTGRILISLCTNYTSRNCMDMKSLLYWNHLKYGCTLNILWQKGTKRRDCLRWSCAAWGDNYMSR